MTINLFLIDNSCSIVTARLMAVDRTLDLIIRVCGGVEALHRAGLVHRDIKPSNIMLDAYGGCFCSSEEVAEVYWMLVI